MLYWWVLDPTFSSRFPLTLSLVQGGAISITPIKTSFAAAEIPKSAGVAQNGLKWRL